MNRNIQRLEELLPLIRNEGKAPPAVVYALEDGRECPLWNLLSITGKVSVAQSFMPDGSAFPIHRHGELEVLIPYEGELEYTLDGDTGRVLTGEALLIPPDVPHCVMANGDTWMIAVTIPDSAGYPHAR